MQVELAPLTRSRRESYQVIDCDVHPNLPNGLSSLYEYMPENWRKRFQTKGLFNDSPVLMGRYALPGGRKGSRVDATPPNGGPPASDPEYTARDLFDEWGIGGAILHNLQTGNQSNIMNTPEESAAVARAGNEFYADRWLGDPRYMLAMYVSPQDPIEAAKEIRRFGQNERVAAVALSPINILMGNRHFWPIYEAAQELELPIHTHVITTQFQYQGAPAPCGGMPESFPEYRTLLAQIGESNVNSLLWTGTFERFPRLKFLFVELGFAWMVPWLWEMERLYASAREDTPWVKKHPTEYIHEHVRFSTQPLPEPPGDQLYQMIDMLGANMLMFSTDYPHFDNDDPRQVLKHLSESDRRTIFVNNALDSFRIPA